MENNEIADFSEFKRRKEEGEAKKVGNKESKTDGLSGMQSLMMDMVKPIRITIVGPLSYRLKKSVAK